MMQLNIKSALTAVMMIIFPVVLKAQENESPPNIIFLLVDDMGYADTGCYGSPFYETPHIDALAQSGMKFMNTYTAGSVCSPSRASIMTGKYPARTGITDWIPGMKTAGTKLTQPETKLFLKKEEIIFAELLKERGYTALYAGKWHLGEGEGPLSQGFDEYYSAKEMRKAKSTVITDSLTKYALDFILRKSNEKKPFMVFLSYYDVHTPLYAYPDYISHYEKKAAALHAGSSFQTQEKQNSVTRISQDEPQYASMVGAVDKSVGSISELLVSLGIEKNTIVVFTSDNGGLSTSRRGGPTSNLPYRSGKGWLYEGGIRVPLIIKYPSVVKAGSICYEPTISTDFYPSILQLAGLPARPDLHQDGVSIVPLLKQEKNSLSRSDFYWHYPHYHGSAWTPGAAVRSGDWKLIELYETNTSELYNLKEDPYEKYNKAAEHPEIVKSLKNKLRKWQNEAGARMPVPNLE